MIFLPTLHLKSIRSKYLLPKSISPLLISHLYHGFSLLREVPLRLLIEEEFFKLSHGVCHEDFSVEPTIYSGFYAKLWVFGKESLIQLNDVVHPVDYSKDTDFDLVPLERELLFSPFRRIEVLTMERASFVALVDCETFALRLALLSLDSVDFLTRRLLGVDLYHDFLHVQERLHGLLGVVVLALPSDKEDKPLPDEDGTKWVRSLMFEMLCDKAFALRKKKLVNALKVIVVCTERRYDFSNVVNELLFTNGSGIEACFARWVRILFSHQNLRVEDTSSMVVFFVGYGSASWVPRCSLYFSEHHVFDLLSQRLGLPQLHQVKWFYLTKKDRWALGVNYETISNSLFVLLYCLMEWHCGILDEGLDKVFIAGYADNLICAGKCRRGVPRCSFYAMTFCYRATHMGEQYGKGHIWGKSDSIVFEDVNEENVGLQYRYIKKKGGFVSIDMSGCREVSMVISDVIP